MAKSQLSRTRLKKRLHKKTSPELAATISMLMKNPAWLKFAKLVSAPARNHAAVNLGEIDKKASAGDTIIIPGKVLSKGEITKKIRICSFSVSAQAKSKLKEAKSEWATILDEIKKNPKAEGLKVVS